MRKSFGAIAIRSSDFEAYLLEQNLASEADLKAIRSKITEVVEDALTFAEESPDPSPADLYKYIFAED